MMQIVEDVDVGSAGDQIWIEPIHYASAKEVGERINELFDVKAANAPSSAGGGKSSAATGGGDLHVAKILPDDRTNSLVIVATEHAYLRILEIIKRLDVPQTGEGEIHVLPLQHADAVDMTKTLNEIISGAGAGTAGTSGGAPKPGGAAPTGVFEAGVKVSADKATNSIVITSSLRDYAQLRAVVDRLDLPRRQVFIDAVVLDLSVNNSNSFGVSFHGADTQPTGSYGDSLLFGGLNPLNTISLPDPSHAPGPRARSPRTGNSRVGEPARDRPHDPGVRRGRSTRSRAPATPTCSRRRTSWRRTTKTRRSTSVRTSRCRRTAASPASAAGPLQRARVALSAPSGAWARSAAPVRRAPTSGRRSKSSRT